MLIHSLSSFIQFAHRHYNDAFARYRDRADRLVSLADFHNAVEDLLTPRTGSLEDGGHAQERGRDGQRGLIGATSAFPGSVG